MSPSRERVTELLAKERAEAGASVGQLYGIPLEDMTRDELLGAIRLIVRLERSGLVRFPVKP